MKFKKDVILLFSWSQRPDLNRGPTDYELLQNVANKGISPLYRTNSAKFLRFASPIRRKSAENSGQVKAVFRGLRLPNQHDPAPRILAIRNHCLEH
jgi:hypothetical protein